MNIFLQNKYTTWYNKIIEHRRTTVADGYTEKHHILPKSLGGTNDQTNLVSLTAKEHYICHLLLMKMTEGKNKHKMVRAFHAFKMASRKNPRALNARRYQHARQTRLGKGNGTPLSEETKRKISKARTGQPSPMKGHKWEGTAYENIVAASKKPERRDKISKALKGRVSPTKGMTHPKTPCPYCGKPVAPNIMARSHGERCKFKNRA